MANRPLASVLALRRLSGCISGGVKISGETSAPGTGLPVRESTTTPWTVTPVSTGTSIFRSLLAAVNAYSPPPLPWPPRMAPPATSTLIWHDLGARITNWPSAESTFPGRTQSGSYSAPGVLMV